MRIEWELSENRVKRRQHNYSVGIGEARLSLNSP